MELLQGKTAIVPGGTRGIGLAVVRVFLQNGARVALFGSRQETADRAVAALKSEEPGWDVIGLAPDLTDFASVQAAVEAVRARFGGVDILVNNAGISAREPLADYTPEAFQEDHGSERDRSLQWMQSRRAHHARGRARRGRCSEGGRPDDPAAAVLELSADRPVQLRRRLRGHAAHPGADRHAARLARYGGIHRPCHHLADDAGADRHQRGDIRRAARGGSFRARWRRR